MTDKAYKAHSTPLLTIKMVPIDISVIVTTRNEEKNITECLNSIRKQSYPRDKIEIIVVDNNSQDKTKESAFKYTDKVFNFGPERSAQRNFGVRQAKGKYILYLDSDMVLSPDVIKECVDKCESGNYIALYIPERIVGEGFWIKVRDFERGFYNATCIDAVRFVRKGKFQEIGGFDEALTGPEDWDFDRRISSAGETAVINSCLYHNEDNFDLKKYMEKKLYYTRDFERYARKWGKQDRIIKRQMGMGYRYFGVFMEKGKSRRLFSRPLLALAMYFLRLSVGLAYVFNPGAGVGSQPVRLCLKKPGY
ncbi:MAG: glycosyltransferase [Candidatus Omnitrophota bacterium]|nr:glycosyltransferase [Candidatus Omnitrophota bacterium]